MKCKKTMLPREFYKYTIEVKNDSRVHHQTNIMVTLPVHKYLSQRISYQKSISTT